MYLNSLKVKGFRCFESVFDIELNTGLNVIVGENGAGKTAIINAIRQLFVDSESGRYFVSEKDFTRGFSKESLTSKEFTINAHFDDLDGDEKVAFLHWCDEKGNASLNLHVENKEVRGRYKRSLWGGKSRTTVFEPETVDLIHCIYLPPLRDAESKLSNGRQSRLSKLLKALSKKELESYRKNEKLHPLEEKVATFNQELAESKVFGIERANNLITDSLKNSIGDHFGQNTLIQFTESDYTNIVEGLRLLFFPNLTKQDNESFRSLEENSLGYNNLLYIASILAELTIMDIEGEIKDSYFKLLLIEEPEAHLHPQLQVRLLKYIAEVAEKKSVQVIVTTHSTVLASSVDIDSIIHLSNSSPTIATPLVKCGLPDGSKQFINRWLDVTKSNLLFASGLILVEGIAEQMLLPLFAKEVLKKGSNSLEDLGVSVINLNGIYFKHFMRLYCNLTDLDKEEDQIGVNIPIRCAGLTDLDPPKSKTTEDSEGVKHKTSIKPYDGNVHEGTNHALKLLNTINASDNSRLFVGKYKTLEYDLAMEGNNIQVMAQILFDLWPTDDESKGIKSELKPLKDKSWCDEPSIDKADAAYIILNRIDDQNIGKGQFSQILADKIANKIVTIEIPQYIIAAIHWACTTEPMANKDD
jgi:putative ATP-dependent endonuclease of OLD family